MIGDRRKPGGQEEAPRGEDMKKELTTLIDFAKFIEAGWVEMPGALMKRLTAAGAEEEAYEAGGKAYDAWVRLANEAINRLYADRTFGETMARAFETELALSRITETFASVFFANMSPALGLPA